MVPLVSSVFPAVRDAQMGHFVKSVRNMKRQLTLISLLLAICTLSAYSDGEYEKRYIKKHRDDTEAPKPISVKTPLLDEASVGQTIKVLLSVNSEGSVISADVVDAEDSRFDTIITDAVKQWKFAPLVKNGSAVKSKVLVPFVVTGSSDVLAMK